MFDHEEAVERLEGYGGYGEKVECDDHLAVVSEKRQPPLTRELRRWTLRGYRATVRSETTKPSFRSSPWILGAPHPAFSSARRRISKRISAVIFGRPLRGPERRRDASR